MISVKVYDPAMQPALEACFAACMDALGWEYQPQGRHADMVHIGEAYMRCGCFWCLFDDARLAGMVAVHCIDEANTIAELKRLYILPRYQGRGCGDMLFRQALGYAKAQGYAALRIDTQRDRAASRHLIEKYGFHEIGRYNGNVHAELFFELDLSKYAPPVDYNTLSSTYDLTRAADFATIGLFTAELPLGGKRVLDFGCGTGNFALALKQLTTAQVYGAEPSDGMRAQALAKGVDARRGDHTAIPFPDGFFDFIYMTDVIHHVPDLRVMFNELARVLQPGGLACVVTESHRQLETRFWVRYFPATVAIERRRYPDIPDIITAAGSAGLAEHKLVNTDRDGEFTISADFVKLVEQKGYSIFRLIDETDYQAGLTALRADYENKTMIHSCHGETLVWLKKEKRNPCRGEHRSPV